MGTYPTKASPNQLQNDASAWQPLANWNELVTYTAQSESVPAAKAATNTGTRTRRSRWKQATPQSAPTTPIETRFAPSVVTPPSPNSNWKSKATAETTIVAPGPIKRAARPVPHA